MKYAELKPLSDEALVHKELQIERQLIAANFRLRTRQHDDPSQLGKLRKDLARTRTEQRARELAKGLRRNALRDQYRSTFVPGQEAPVEAAPKGGGFLKGIASRLGIGRSVAEPSAGEAGD